MATGLRHKLDLREVAAAALMSGLNAKLDNLVPNIALRGVFKAGSDELIESAIYGEAPSAEHLLATYVGDVIQDEYTAYRAKLQREAKIEQMQQKQQMTSSQPTPTTAQPQSTQTLFGNSYQQKTLASSTQAKTLPRNDSAMQPQSSSSSGDWVNFNGYKQTAADYANKIMVQALMPTAAKPQPQESIFWQGIDLINKAGHAVDNFLFPYATQISAQHVSWQGIGPAAIGAGKAIYNTGVIYSIWLSMP